jgi:hypothetical protein
MINPEAERILVELEKMVHSDSGNTHDPSRIIIGESDEWRSWYKLTPQKRWLETKKLWDFYLKAGGSLDPEPDSQSPFRNAWLPGAFSTHRRSSMHIIRRV